MCIGAVRSDDVAVESVEEIVTHVKKASLSSMETLFKSPLIVGNGCSLDNIAFQKLKNLAAAGEILNGG